MLDQLSIKSKSLLVGSILGDGYITKYNEAKKYPSYLSIQHSCKQESYLAWKIARFKELGFQTTAIYHVDHGGFCSRRGNIRLGKELGKYLRHQLYPNGNKTVTRHLLNMLDAEGLAIWYMDDGSLVYDKRNQSRHMRLATHCFTLEEINLIVKYFKSVWNIEVVIKFETKRGKSYPFLRINVQNAKKLHNIIKPFIHDSMTYKIDFKYPENSRYNKGLD